MSTPRATSYASATPSAHDVARRMSIQALLSPVNSTKKKKAAKRKTINTARRREQCRRNQQRYRDRERHRIGGLEQDVLQLQLDFAHLVGRRQALHDRVYCDHAAAQIVMEFYRLLSRGFDDRRPQHIALMNAVVDEHIFVADEVQGRDGYINQLRLLPILYDNFEGTLEHLHVVHGHGESTIVYEDVQAKLTISDQSIVNVFPHLLEPQHKTLRQKLVGSRLSCGIKSCHEIDARGRVVRAEWSVDFVAALTRVLTLEETARTLGDAHMLHDAYLLMGSSSDCA